MALHTLGCIGQGSKWQTHHSKLCSTILKSSKALTFLKVLQAWELTLWISSRTTLKAYNRSSSLQQELGLLVSNLLSPLLKAKTFNQIFLNNHIISHLNSHIPKTTRTPSACDCFFRRCCSTRDQPRRRPPHHPPPPTSLMTSTKLGSKQGTAVSVRSTQRIAARAMVLHWSLKRP